MAENKKAATSAPPPVTAKTDEPCNTASPPTLYQNIPQELKQFKNWVVRVGKIPYNPLTNKPAKANDPSTWEDYNTVVTNAARYSGIGFQLSNSPFVGVDLDHHIDKETGQPDEFAKSILDKLNSYSEISPSGDGCHIIVKGTIPEAMKNSTLGLEMYTKGRYFTMTGKALPAYGNIIQERSAELLELFEECAKKPAPEKTPTPKQAPDKKTTGKDIALNDDDRLINVMRNYDKTGKFKALFDMGDISGYNNDHSRADAALLETLAYYTKCDPVRMERLFSMSALGQRDKWTTRPDYRAMSTQGAIGVCIQRSPKVHGVPKDTIDTNQFWDDNKFLHHVFGEWLIKEYNIIRAYECGRESEAPRNPLLYYNREKGVYDLAELILNRLMLGFIDDLKSNQRKEVVEYIKNRAPLREQAASSLIALQNGIYNLIDKQIYAPSPDIVVINKVPVVYDPRITHSEPLFTFLNTLFCGNPEMMNFIFEVIGYGLAPNNFMQKFFLLIGEGGNGKSAFLGVLERFYGRDNISSLSLADIGARFLNAQLYGKMINIGDDIEGNNILETALLKKVTSGEQITVENKGRDPFAFTPRTKLFFAANKIPRIYDTSQGMNDRLVIIPFLVRIRETAQADPHIISKLSAPEVLSCLLNYALCGLERLIINNRFTMPDVVKEYIGQYTIDNDPIAQFVSEAEAGEITQYTSLGETVFRIEGTKTATVYDVYSNWAKNNGYKPLSSRGFGREIKRLGYESQDVKKTGARRVYIKCSHSPY